MNFIQKAYSTLKKTANNMALKKKLLFIYVAAFVLPVLFISLYTIRGMIQISNEKSHVQNQAQCEQISVNIGTKLNDFYKAVLNFSTNPIISSYFTYEYPDSSSFFSAYPKVNLHISSFLASNPQIDTFTIYTNNPTFFTNDSTILTFTPEIEAEYKQLKNAYTTPPVITANIEGDSQNGFRLGLSGSLSSDSHSEYCSLLHLSYPEDIFYSYYRHNPEKMELYLITPAGKVFSSSNRSCIGRDAGELDIIQDFIQAGFPENTLTKNGQNYYFVNSFSDMKLLKGWKIYISVSETSYLHDVQALTGQTLMMIALLSLCGLLLYVLLSLSITRRLKRLVNTMSEIRNDETLDVVLETDSTDEIGILSKNFDQMLKRLKKLIFDVYISDLQVKNLEIENKQAQLLALQSQINPHFLFNTMQSLVINCYNNDDYETADYINKFCSFLRDSLYWETKCIPLSQEIRIADNYLALQKLRFQDPMEHRSLEYQIHIAPEFAEIPIPKFSLQPLVENALEHGLWQKRTEEQAGLIRITACAVKDMLLITVEDNGAGIPADKLQVLNDQLRAGNHEQSSESIGIFNTNERLRLFYGSDFCLNIQSEAGTGTKVTIRIPVTET